MKISDVEAWLCHFPLQASFSPSWIPGYSSTMNSCVIYRLRTDEGLDGICGWVAFADEARGPVNIIRAYISGLDVEETDEVNRRLMTMSRVLGIRAWFLEVAFWDLKGKAAGKSISELLGGRRDRIRAYASTGQVRTAEEAGEHARKVIDKGFRGIKIRPRHADFEDDVAMVKAVRSSIGDDIALMCDANQAWRVDTFGQGPVWDRERALASAKAMEEFGVEWLEEPLDMYDLEGYRELRKRTSTKIAAGELHGDPGLVRLLVEADGVDIVQPDLTFTGGVTGAWSLAKLAQGKGLAFSPHTWSNGLGLAANLHLAVAAPNCEWLEFPYDPPGWVPESRDAMLTNPIEIDDEGNVLLPRGPGLGVELDEERLAASGITL